ncbi:MAG: cation-translocating P-type ATPase [bacterium]
MKQLWSMPGREFVLIGFVLFALALDIFLPVSRSILFVAALIGAIPTLIASVRSIWKREMSIETFNIFAVVVSFATGEYRSAAFIVLMLAFARLLDWKTQSRTQSAVEELLRLKPTTVIREGKDGKGESISVSDVSEGDIIIVKESNRVPVDGIIVHGEGAVDESSVTGESMPRDVGIDDHIVSSTLLKSGFLKMRALRVGRDSTIEKMITLMREAVLHKSRSERLADRFATFFFPLVLLVGVAVYFFTHDFSKVAAIFLVACADDMAVAIPLAVSASLGSAARRGVIVKGGEWIEKIAKIDTLVLDKTGTLTYGAISVSGVYAEGMSEKELLTLAASAEKFSEHPLSQAVVKKALAEGIKVTDPKQFSIIRGKGVTAQIDSKKVSVGSAEWICSGGLEPSGELTKAVKRAHEFGEMAFMVSVSGKISGVITISDTPRAEAKKSIEELQRIGIKHVVMLTGDHESVARHVADALGIREYSSKMTPEGKVREVEKLTGHGTVAMVGDGINDAPALSRADVGVAMGSAGTAVTVEASNVVIMNDDLSRIGELILLSRRTMSVIRADGWIWFITNIFGFVLVFAGVLGPIGAAAYNFGTDFLPLINSGRLFRRGKNEV